MDTPEKANGFYTICLDYRSIICVCVCMWPQNRFSYVQNRRRFITIKMYENRRVYTCCIACNSWFMCINTHKHTHIYITENRAKRSRWFALWFSIPKSCPSFDLCICRKKQKGEKTSNEIGKKKDRLPGLIFRCGPKSNCIEQNINSQCGSM